MISSNSLHQNPNSNGSNKSARNILSNDIVSFWKLRKQITGGRWYHIFRAVPKTTVGSQGDFVIKFINPKLDAQQSQIAIDRLCREAISTDRIKHTGVIPLMDAELDHHPFFLVQPWVEGTTHDQMMAREKTIALNRLMWTFRQTGEAILAGHENGRVHLGLHPSHILQDRVGRTTLIGWSNSHGIDQTVRYANEDLGVARYRAPETFGDTFRASKANDVYSLGVLIYHSLTGRDIGAGIGLNEIAAGHLSANAQNLDSVLPDCPPDLADLTAELLNGNPDARPPLDEVIERLTSIEIEHLDNATPIRM